MARLTGVLDMQELASCDLIIEAVFEDMDQHFQKPRRHCQTGGDFGDQYLSAQY